MIKWLVRIGGAVVLGIGGMAAIGSLLPRGHVATRETRLGRPIRDAYAAIADVSRYPEWRPDVRVVRVLSSEPLRWNEEGANGTITFEVEEATPPSRLVVRIADPDLPFGGRWIYELTAASDESTHLTISERGEIRNPVFRFLSRFVFSQTATIDAYVKHLGERLGAPAGGGRGRTGV